MHLGIGKGGEKSLPAVLSFRFFVFFLSSLTTRMSVKSDSESNNNVVEEEVRCQKVQEFSARVAYFSSLYASTLYVCNKKWAVGNCLGIYIFLPKSPELSM